MERPLDDFDLAAMLENVLHAHGHDPTEPSIQKGIGDLLEGRTDE